MRPHPGITPKGRRRPPRLTSRGALIVAGAALIIFSALTLRIPFLPAGGQVITARLASVADARVGQPVRVGGVDIGQIAAIAAGPNGSALLTLRINSGITVHADATVDLRWRTFFGGNMMVALDPGSPSAPQLKGTIPLSATRTQVEFDQLLQPLHADGRSAVRQTLTQASIALAHPAAPRADAALLEPTMRGTATTIGALRGTHSGDLETLVRSTGDAATALSASEQNLGDLIDSAQITLSVAATRREDIGRLLNESPAALVQTATTMRQLRGTLDRLEPIVADLKPAAPLLAPAVTAADPALLALGHTLNRLEPALSSLAGALDGLRTLAPVADRVLTHLTPSLRRLRHTILPALDRVQPSNRLKLYEAIGPAFAAATSSFGEFDGRGHMVRYQVNGLAP